MSSLPVVAIDLDEVLGYFVPQIALFHNDAFGTSFTAESFFSYDFSHVWGGDRAEANAKVSAFFESPFFRGAAGEGIPVVAGAKEVLEKYRGKLEFHVVTSRQLSIEDTTRSWLLRHYPGIFAGVHFGNHHSDTGRKLSKPDMCRAIGACLLVDDALAYARECAAAGIRVALHGRYAWNAVPDDTPLPDNVVRTDTWVDVDRILEELAEGKVAVPVGESSGEAAAARPVGAGQEEAEEAGAAAARVVSVAVSAARPSSYFSEVARQSLHEGGADAVTLRAMGKAVS